MKILHLCLANFYIDGYAYQENILPRYHANAGMDVVIVASLVSIDREGSPCLLERANEYVNEDGISVVRLDYKPGILNKITRRYIGLKSVLERESPDILFIHGCQFADMDVVIKYLNQSSKKIDVYVDNHADFVNSARNWLSKYILHGIIYRHFAQRILPHAKKFYGVLPVRCDFLTDVYGIPKEKIELLVMGIDDKAFEFAKTEHPREKTRHELDMDSNDFVLMTGGKIDPKKNIDLLLKAFQEIDDPGMKFIVFGTPTPDVKPVFERLIAHDRIKYIGWLKGNEIYKYLIASDLAVFPGTHSVLWEQTVGSGLPAVFKHWDGMQHVDVGGNCLFLKPVTVETIQEAILRIRTDQQLFETMKNVAQEKGLKEFSYREIAARSIKDSFTV